MRAHATDGSMLGAMTPSPQSSDKVSVVAVCLWKQGTHSLTIGQSVFPPKCLDHCQRAAQVMSYAPTHNLPPFLGKKTPILWVAGSLWTGIDLVRTDPEDRDYLLDNGFAGISLRAHS